MMKMSARPAATPARGLQGLIAAAALAALAGPARAVEFGYPGWSQPPGTFLGITAATAPTGLYGFTQAYSAQARLVGPGAPHPNGGDTQVHVASGVLGLVWVPSWTLLGGRYDALLIQPFSIADASAPLNATKSGAHNTVVVPGELSWKLGDSGLFLKTGFAVSFPDAPTDGTNGLSRIGNPWWIYQPIVVASYLKDGWNLTANLSEEFNTRNSLTHYKSGNIAHAEFTATHAFGQWTVGPVATYVGQVSDDKSSAFYHGAVSADRFHIWSAGGTFTYNFGPVTTSFSALKDLSANASGGSIPVPGPDTASITKGFKFFAGMSFRFAGL